MGHELFVYWHVEAALAAPAIAAARTFQHALCRNQPGLVARLYQRTAAAQGRVTVMETYAQPGGMDNLLQAALAAAGTQAPDDWCPGARHLEVFEPVG